VEETVGEVGSEGNVPNEFVASVGEGLLHLLAGGLGRVGGHALAELGVEVFASEV
jgi:hypothetical protein